MTLPPGTLLGQRYEVSALVGGDGRLNVYKGLDLRLGRDVALTVLEPGSVLDPEDPRAFEQEARIRAGLHHPRIMTVYDFGHGPGCVFQVAEWLDGQSLRRRLRCGPVRWSEARHIGEAVLGGLVIMLRKGYALHSLDTASVFIQSDGHVKLFAYRLRKVEGHTILKAQKEGLQALAGILVTALGDGGERMDPAAERVLPALKRWSGNTDLDASSLRREMEHLLREAPLLPAPSSRCRWVAPIAFATALAVVGVLLRAGGRSTPASPPPQPKPVTGNAEATRLYLQAMAWLETMEPGNLRKAQAYLQRAAETDARSATAFSGLARCYCLLGLLGQIPREEAGRRAAVAAKTALRLEPDLGEAHAAKALHLFWYVQDWKRAEQAYRRALELSPDQAVTLRDCGRFLAMYGHMDAGLGLYQTVLARDPLSRSARTERAVFLHWAGRSRESLMEFAVALEQAPDSRDTLENYRAVLEQQGRIAEALDATDRLAALGALPVREVVALRTAYEGCGAKGYWTVRLRQEELRPGADPARLAELAAQQGDTQRALRLVARSLREKSLLAVRIPGSPALAELRPDPAFGRLLRRAEFPAP